MRPLTLILCLAALGCGKDMSERGLPCPCASGWMCCTDFNICVPEGDECSGEGFPDAPMSNPYDYRDWFGPSCQVTCPGTATTVLDENFEDGSLEGWFSGPDGTASVVCDSSVEGSCYLETTGTGLARYQTFATQTGAMLLSAYVRPVTQTNGGSVYLRTAPGSSGVGFTFHDDQFHYPYQAAPPPDGGTGGQGEEHLQPWPPDTWNCLATIIDVPAEHPADSIATVVGEFYNGNWSFATIPYVDAVNFTTFELSNGDTTNTLRWDAIKLTQCVP